MASAIGRELNGSYFLKITLLEGSPLGPHRNRSRMGRCIAKQSNPNLAVDASQLPALELDETWGLMLLSMSRLRLPYSTWKACC